MSLHEAAAPRRRLLRLRPLSRAVTRPVSVLVLFAWVATMAILVNGSYLQASLNLAADLSRYGSAAEWRGVYYRGAKIGFTVRQVLPIADGFRLEEKPTVGFPSAREVLRTKIGDCNEHTALYVAMARALGIPTRVAVGLVYMRGAFYYHAWPEVYLDGLDGDATWLAVDPTLKQFPADGTHIQLARGGLDRQTAMLPLIGRLQMTVLELELASDSTPVLLAAPAIALENSAFPMPTLPRDTEGWCGCTR